MGVGATSVLESQLEVRGALLGALERDLIGPAAEDESIDEPPLTRYMTGILYPSIDAGRRITAEREAQDDTSDDDGDYAADPAVAMSNVQYPTSAGITFAVDPEETTLEVILRAARYRKEGDEDEEMWKREPLAFEPHAARPLWTGRETNPSR